MKAGFLFHRCAERYLRDKDSEIDFINFCQDYINQLRKENRNGTADNHRTVLNSLKDYFKRNAVSIKEINSNMLTSYERFLRTERVMIRLNQTEKEARTVKKGLSDSGLHNHMRDLRTMFNAAAAGCGYSECTNIANMEDCLCVDVIQTPHPCAYA